MSLRQAAKLAAMFVALGAAATALAQDPPATEAPKAKPKADPDQMVCESTPVLGSRLAKHRICMTRAQWAERQRTDRESVDHSQINSCQQGAGC